MGSGIASASRKPVGSRGSWLKQGQAGYLSPRAFVRTQYIHRRQARIECVQRRERKMPNGQGHASRLVHMPVKKPGRLGAILPCPIASGFCARPPCPRRHVRSKQVVYTRLGARRLCLLEPLGAWEPGSLDWAGLDLWDFGEVSVVSLAGRAQVR